MGRLIVTRLLGMIPLLILISLMVSLLINLVPGDPAYAILGDNATPEAVASVNEQLGLDEPFLARYFDWISGVLHGDFGQSLFGGESVSRAILDRTPVTVSLVVAAATIQLLVGVTSGIIGGFRPGNLLDRSMNLAAGVLLAVPGFWLGMLLILYISERYGWLPATGYEPLGDGLWGWLSHLILPSLALAGAGTAELYRQTRAAVIETSERDFVRTARAFGLKEGTVARRTVAKNSMVPVITVFGLQLGRMIGVAAVIESVFGMQGIGSLVVNASLNADFPVVQGVVLVTATVVLIVNLLVDISYRYFNPKLRAS